MIVLTGQFTYMFESCELKLLYDNSLVHNVKKYSCHSDIYLILYKSKTANNKNLLIYGCHLETCLDSREMFLKIQTLPMS